jgi:cell wall-associated NlpC family hydrolase
MLGMCDYYNDPMKASKAAWYDTNMTNFSPADTFEQAISARRKGANCNSLLNWSWHDMDIKSGHRASLYGQRDSGKIHGYNGSNRSLRSLVDKCCDVTSAHGEKTRSMERSGKLKPGDMMFMPLHTFIYRGEGTVFASAGDAKFRRKGHDLIILDCIEGSKSYDWRKRITYKMRFKDDYIPPKYRNKEGEIVDNPMYVAQQQGESPWTGKRSPTERKAAGMEPVTFVLGDQEETAEEAAAQQTTPEKSTGDQSQPDSSAPAVPVTPVGEDAAAAPITGHITATIPEAAVEEEVPRTVNGKPYSNHPSTGKKAKKKHKHKKSKKKASDAQNGSASVSNT